MHWTRSKKDKVIDLVAEPRFIKVLPTGHIAVVDRGSATGIVGSDNQTLYSFVPTIRNDISLVKIEQITAKEFNRLESLLNSGKEVCADESALAQAKRETLKRLSTMCNIQIVNGFSVVLQDGKSYNFKLTTEDQLNLINIESQLNAGVESFVYHATNQPCQVFTRDDMQKIVTSFRKHLLYHTTYFNMAKQYINASTDINSVNKFAYGTDISDSVEDKLLRRILKNGGSY